MPADPDGVGASARRFARHAPPVGGAAEPREARPRRIGPGATEPGATEPGATEPGRAAGLQAAVLG